MKHIGKEVILDPTAFVHETAQLSGKVKISKGASVFPFVVMRSEIYEVTIGRRTNIQEFAMIQVGDFTPTIIGDDCSISTRVTLRGCMIGNRCLIGINSTVMDGARIGDNSIVAGHSMVDKGAEFEANSIIAGVPARKIGERDNSALTLLNSSIYQIVSENYKNQVERFTSDQLKVISAQANHSR